MKGLLRILLLSLAGMVGVAPAALANVDGAVPPREALQLSYGAAPSIRPFHDRRPVNVRSDGSIRHRQHHPTCFPRCN